MFQQKKFKGSYTSYIDINLYIPDIIYEAKHSQIFMGLVLI